MASLNKVTLLGNLTRDPELRHTPKGTAVAELAIATNRRVKDSHENWIDEPTFLDVTVWGNTAENCQKYLTKGRGVLIEARLTVDKWIDKETGNNRQRLMIIGERVQFLPQSGRTPRHDSAAEPAAARPPAARQPPAALDDSLDQDPDDDIPF